MTVYVDNMQMRCKLFGWNGTWSNLWADTTQELIDFADEVIDLSRASMVDEGYVTERFVITEARRQKAISAGAHRVRFGGGVIMELIEDKLNDPTKDWKAREL